MFLDFLQAFALAILVGHPERALKTSESRDGHVEAHGVQEPDAGALSWGKYCAVNISLESGNELGSKIHQIFTMLAKLLAGLQKSYQD